jgi:hypothetical protein
MSAFQNADDTLRQIYLWLQELKNIHYPFDKRPFDEWVSRPPNGPWLMLADPEIPTILEAKNSHRPNLYISVSHEDLSIFYIGVTYNTNPGVQIFEGLASPASGNVRMELLDIVRSIANDWKFSVNRKRKLGYFAASPDYTLEKTWTCLGIGDDELTSILDTLKHIRETRALPGTLYRGEKLVWEVPSLDVMQGSFPLEKEVICNRFLEAYSIFNRCLCIPSPGEVVVGEARLQMLYARKNEIEKVIKKEKAGKRKKKYETMLAECKGEIADITGIEVK